MNKTYINNWHKRIGLFIILSMSMVFSLNAAPMKIMMLGDSITSGTGPKPLNPEQNMSVYEGVIAFEDQIAYRGKLWLLLKDEGYTFGSGDDDLDFVGTQSKNSSTFQDANPGFDEDHEGYGGITSGELLNGRINDANNTEGNMTRILNHHIPDIVLLHIGTNDGAKSIPMATTVENVKQILNKIFEYNSDAKIFVARIIEARRAHYNAGNWITNDLNNLVRDMVAAHPQHANIKMVDLNSGAGMIYDPCGTTLGDMQPYVDLSPEPIPANIFEILDFHPNVNGYEKMASKWATDIINSGWLTDITPPVITLIEGNKTIEVNATYTDAGATAQDNNDGDISANIVVDTSTVNISAEGNYTVTYDVNDSSGNEAEQVTRNVEVVVQVVDNTPPVIVLNGAETITLAVGDTYAELGATASDDVDGNITNVIVETGTVDTTKAGTYTIKYTVTDAAGNAAEEVVRTVTVNAAVVNPSKEWLNYEATAQTATITPVNGAAQSILKVSEITAQKVETADSIALEHTFVGKKAYVKSNSNAEVTTGFNTDDSTLKSGAFFKAGSTAVISKLNGKIIISINTKLSKNQSMTVGGK